MARKKQPVKETSAPPKLVKTREEAREKIVDRITKGKTLKDAPISDTKMLEDIENQASRWSDYNYELLQRIFDNSSIADEYSMTRMALGFVTKLSFSEEVQNFRKSISIPINSLESILERLDLIPEITTVEPTIEKTLSETPTPTNDVFIVHGHDEGAKESLARFLAQLELNPIILHEQANEGNTVIEKFENYASSASYAVILMTPDDVGFAKGESDKPQPRARQNVILELGYFIGKLSRKRVCALYKEGVEIPSDYHGVIFIPMDVNGAWKFKLAKELKTAGMNVDMNSAI